MNCFTRLLNVTSTWSRKIALKLFICLSLVILIGGQQALALTQNDIDCQVNDTCFYDPTATACGSSSIDTSDDTTDDGNGSTPVIVIDPGHSGDDIHDTDPQTGLYDHDYPNHPEISEVFTVAQKVQKQLTSDGYKVVMTKNSVNDDVSFRKRADIANQANADLALSIHDSHASKDQPSSYDHMYGQSYGGQVYVQKVGDYRQNQPSMGKGNKKITFTDSSVATLSQKYGQIFADQRTKDEGHTVEVAPESFDGRSGLPGGNLPMVQLFSKVPWVYNEVGAGVGNLSGSQLDSYAKGIVDGVEKSVPVSGNSSNPSPADSTDDSTGGCCDGSSTTPTTTSGTGANNKFTIDQVKTFASEPATSTWNISNSAVEQWFLKQAGAQSTIARYGLDSSNIGKITAAVQSANVSPVFFYLDTVTEGGGAGGFINHFGSDVSGGGPANATRDAQYIAAESQTTADGPAAGGGEPGDMPTGEAKSLLNALPKGGLGVYYIQATAAVTAEVETLSGQTGDWSGKFGMPLSDTMQNIQTLGGDPSQGGVAVSGTGCTTSGVTGTGMQKAISFAVFIAKNNGYGYDQNTRASGWAKYQSNQSCTTACGSFDCASLIAAALTEAGYFKTNPEFYTGNEAEYLTGAGFKKIADSATTSKDLLPGDIMLWDGHTEMYIGNDQAVAAHINEFGQVNGGQVGDQNGKEISVESYEASLSTDQWIGIYRASN